MMGSHHFLQELLWLPPSQPKSKTKAVVGASRFCLRAGTVQAGLQAGLRADSTVWPKEPPCHCRGPLTVSFPSRDVIAIFVSDEFTAAITAKGEGLVS